MKKAPEKYKYDLEVLLDLIDQNSKMILKYGGIPPVVTVDIPYPASQVEKYANECIGKGYGIRRESTPEGIKTHFSLKNAKIIVSQQKPTISDSKTSSGLFKKDYPCPHCDNLIITLVPSKASVDSKKPYFDSTVQCPDCKELHFKKVYASGLVRIETMPPSLQIRKPTTKK